MVNESREQRKRVEALAGKLRVRTDKSNQRIRDHSYNSNRLLPRE